MTKRILIIEDDKYLRLNLIEVLSSYGLIDEASSFKEARDLITENSYDLVITDIELGDGNAIELLPRIRLKGAQCIVISSHQNEQFIEDAYNKGAQYYLSKQEVRKELPRYIQMLSNKEDKKLDDFFENIYQTQDETLKNQVRSLFKIPLHNKHILITGPSGVGKSLLGKLIHDISRPKGQLIHINCSEIPENLLESELFGHTKGAFTGADKDHIGKLTLANQGTLFLDEVGTMSLPMQQKLLKAIEEKTYYPVGSTKAIKSEFTLITATCENLEEKIGNQEFREDFFYRINGLSLEIPALKYRINDIDLLTAKYIKNASRKFIVKKEAIDILKNQSWPGNIREYFKLLEKIEYSEFGIIDSKNVINFLIKSSKTEGIDSFAEISKIGLKSYIAEIERKAVKESMKRHNGKVTNCIKELKISASAFYRILNEVHI